MGDEGIASRQFYFADAELFCQRLGQCAIRREGARMRLRRLVLLLPYGGIPKRVLLGSSAIDSSPRVLSKKYIHVHVGHVSDGSDRQIDTRPSLSLPAYILAPAQLLDPL